MMNFDKNRYIQERFADGKQTHEMSREEYDRYEEEYESRLKNLNNLLRCFIQSDQMAYFSFEIKVLAYFPLDVLSSDDIKKFIDHVFKLKADVMFQGNKFKYNLSKVSIDEIGKREGERSFDFFMLKSEKRINDGMVHWQKWLNRSTVRAGSVNLEKLVNDTVTLLEAEGSKAELSSLVELVHLVHDLLLQIIVYWVCTCKGLTYEKKKLASVTIKDELRRFKNEVYQAREIGVLSVEDAVSNFVTFLTLRNDFGSYLEILKVLEKEQQEYPELFARVDDAFKVSKNDWVSEDEIERIIAEGKNEYEFRTKLSETKALIEAFSKYGNRNVNSESILDQKVYFREIFISESKYHRQAKSIVRKYNMEYQARLSAGESLNTIVKSFQKESEYRFLREKISRGYFRETTDIRMYQVKNELQELLSEVLLEIVLLYDYEKSIKYLKYLTTDFPRLCIACLENSFF